MTQIIVNNPEWQQVAALKANEKQTLLQQIQDAGYPLHNACQMGICAACMCHIATGHEAIIKDAKTPPGFPLADDEVMTCIAKVDASSSGDITLTTMY